MAVTELDLDGMRCASCAAAVERGLNRLGGVRATVNIATGRATVEHDPDQVGADALCAAVERAGYRAAPRRAAAPARDREGADRAPAVRLVAGAALAVPVALLAMAPALQFGGWRWLALALATPVVLWCGLPFHRGALRAARGGRAGMDTLVSLGALAAWGWSVAATVAGGGRDVYFEVAAGIVVLILLGRWLEGRARRRAGDALRALTELGAKDAALLRDGREVMVPVEALVPGDRFVVRPGERVATDGVVERGTSAVDASLVTGESLPVEVGPGSEVTGATVNAGGRLVVRATRVGADTAVARIGALVEGAQAGKAAAQRLADRVSGVFVPAVLVLALATLAGWLATGDGAGRSIEVAVSVLIIACPCALGLATPMALLVGTGRGAQLGILVRGPEALESTRRVTTVVLDKTGTLTQGRMRVARVVPAPGVDAGEVLRLAASAEEGSEHPAGRAIVAAGRERGALAAAEAFASRAGVGVEATIEGRRVEVGRPG